MGRPRLRSSPWWPSGTCSSTVPTDEQLAAVSEKNHRFANTNPNAQFYEKHFDREKLLGLPLISPPLRLGDCASMTDGAAAVVLATEERVREFTDTPAWIRGTGQYSDFHNLANAGSLTDWAGLRTAAHEAYRSAGSARRRSTSPRFTIASRSPRSIEYESLGFCPAGQGGAFVLDGQADIGGKIAVNPRGGLLGCGHPLGATGVAQAVEVYQQFAQQVPAARQVPDPEWALVHNLSGSANVHSLMVYQRGARDGGRRGAASSGGQAPTARPRAANDAGRGPAPGRPSQRTCGARGR